MGTGWVRRRTWLRRLQLHEERRARREGRDHLQRRALEQAERLASRAGQLAQQGPLARVRAVVRLQHGQLLPREAAVHARDGLQRHHAARRPVLEPLPRGLRTRRLARAEGKRRARRPHRHAVVALHCVVARERAHGRSDALTLLCCESAAQQPQPRLVRALNGSARAGRPVARRAPLDAMIARRHTARARGGELLGEERRLRERGVDHLVAPEGEVQTEARQRRQQCAARCVVRNAAAAAREAWAEARRRHPAAAAVPPAAVRSQHGARGEEDADTTSKDYQVPAHVARQQTNRQIIVTQSITGIR